MNIIIKMILLILFNSFLFSNKNTENYIIRKTNEKFNEVND